MCETRRRLPGRAGHPPHTGAVIITGTPTASRASLLLALCALTTALTVQPGHAAQPRADASCATSVPFTAHTEGYQGFRVPAVVAVDRAGPDSAPVLIAFAEGRTKSLDDLGDIDLVARRSVDGGCTWGPLQVVAENGTDAVNNPAPIVDPATGRVVLTTSRNPNSQPAAPTVWVQHSDDQGATWSRPREITAAVKPSLWRGYATGPGHGLALRHGPYAGRLLVPGNHTFDIGHGRRRGAHSLYSDDGGATWHLGYVAQPEGRKLELNESTFAELPDGRIYTNVRNQYGSDKASRADAYLAPGGTRLLRDHRLQPQLTGPVVHGSTLSVVPPGSPPLLVFSGPADPDERRAMTLRVSRDDGRTWRSGPRLTTGPAAYSDLVQLDADTIGVLYETGSSTPYEKITFRRVPLRDVAASR